MIREAQTSRPLPIAKGKNFMGLASQFQRDPLGMMGRLFGEYGEAVKLHFFGPFYGYLFCHPVYYKHILQDNNSNYTKQPTPSFQVLGASLGSGLLTSDGDFWLRQRRLAQPAFHRKRIAEFVTTMVALTEKMLERWEAWPEDRPIEFATEMHRLTLEIVGRTLFSRDLTGEAGHIGESLDELSQLTIALTTSPFGIYSLKVPFWPSTRRLRQINQGFDKVVYEMIAERRANPTDRGDLLSMFMLTRDEETGATMSDKQLRDEALTMILAGHETTAVTLAWLMILLGRHPDIREKVEEELAEVLGGRSPTMEDYPNLVYTNQVVSEALRLYPPAYVIARYGHEADEINGYEVGKDAIISLSTYHLHRLPEFWPDPERFDPSRFSKEQSAERARFAYMPFGGGPRQCIGNQFALVEAAVLLAMILQRFDFQLAERAVVEIDPLITLRPKGTVPVYLKKKGG